MRVRCGWAQIVDPARQCAVARGLVFVRHPPLPYAARGRWEGEVHLLRGHDSLRCDVWLLRFENDADPRWIEIESIERTPAPSGLRATARIVSHDDEFPPQVIELGGDE